MFAQQLTRRSLIGITAALTAFTRGTAAPQPDRLPADPLLATEELSRLENLTNLVPLYTLYGHMHPDAQAFIPRYAVIGWYQADFQPRGPQQSVATGVTYLPSWTWPVTGVAYDNVAEVAYTQAFADGTVEQDVVHLAMVDGAWRWFFGRSQAFVDEQIARFDQRQHVPQGGEVPFGLTGRHTIEPTLLSRLPSRYAGPNGSSCTLHPVKHRLSIPTWASGGKVMDYLDDQPFAGDYHVALGSVAVWTLKPNVRATDVVSDAVNKHLDPPDRLLGWNLDPENALPWATFSVMGEIESSRQLLDVSDGVGLLEVLAMDDLMLETIVGSLA